LIPTNYQAHRITVMVAGTFMYELFCLCADAPRDLPAFPTRRSSDLSGPTAAGSDTRGRCRSAGSATRHPAAATPGPGAARARRRSEEHTSELQSRRDLVCRLLLEKKKKSRPLVWSKEIGSELGVLSG